MSLDVFRGMTIAGMMLVNNQGASDAYGPLKHAEWHGWTFTDTVFPFFLWIAGVAMTLSFARRVEEGADRGKLLLHVLRRSAIIFGLGLFLNGFPYFDFWTLRIPGVLQRIAVCYFFAGMACLYLSRKAQAAAAVACMAAYWVLMTQVPVPGYGAGVLEVPGNFEQYVDQMFLTGHMYSATKTWDPEGIVSTLPAITTTLAGVLTGHLLRSGLGLLDKVGWMFFSGNVLIFLSVLMEKSMPYNKKLWTNPYAVLMSGLALVVFACCYWLTDVKGWKGWTKPLAIYGSNAIAVYCLAGLFSKLMGMTGWKKPLIDGLVSAMSPANASLIYGLAHVALFYLVSLFLYRRGWFLKF